MAQLVTILRFPNYEIDVRGNVYSKKRQIVLKPRINNKGYKFIRLYKDGKVYTKLVHRLILETFVGPCPKEKECRHLDGNPKNNNINNLKWGTKSENAKDAIKHRTFACLKVGENSTNHKLTKQDVMEVWKLWRSGMCTQGDIAKTYNVHHTTIHYIVTDKTWKHIWNKEYDTTT